MTAAALCWVSSNSSCGTESATIPAPACTWATPSLIWREGLRGTSWPCSARSWPLPSHSPRFPPRRWRRITISRRRRSSNGRSPDRSENSTAAQLQRGFKVYREVCRLSRPQTAGVPQSRRAGRARIHARAGRGHRRRIQGQGRAQRQGRDDRARRPPGRPLPAAVPERQCAARGYNAVPPDMSVIAKARGYERGFPLVRARHVHPVPGARRRLHRRAAHRATRTSRRRASRSRPARIYNKYFPGHTIAMPPP